MPRRQRQLIVVTAALLVSVVVIAGAVLPGLRCAAPPTPRPTSRAQDRVGGAASPTPTPAGRAVRSYALSLADLQGLAPDTRPGARLELWVTWEPPVTRRARIDLLMDDAVLDKIVPALSPERPDTALLLVKASRIADLLWADRYGALSATVVP